MKPLLEYPSAIAHCQNRLLCQEQYIRRLQSIVDALTLEIDRQVAFDEQCRNEAQRKVKRAELMADPNYVTAVEQLEFAQDKRTDLLTELTLLKNQFSALKLQMRWDMATLGSDFEQVA
ncbi:MAG: hypothetical protein WCA35_01305 [Kovacikia sp.]